MEGKTEAETWREETDNKRRTETMRPTEQTDCRCHYKTKPQHSLPADSVQSHHHHNHMLLGDTSQNLAG